MGGGVNKGTEGTVTVAFLNRPSFWLFFTNEGSKPKDLGLEENMLEVVFELVLLLKMFGVAAVLEKIDCYFGFST